MLKPITTTREDLKDSIQEKGITMEDNPEGKNLGTITEVTTSGNDSDNFNGNNSNNGN